MNFTTLCGGLGSAPLGVERNHPLAARFAMTFLSLLPQPELHEFRPQLFLAPDVAPYDVLAPARKGPMLALAPLLQLIAYDAQGPGFEFGFEFRKFAFLCVTHVDTTYVILCGVGTEHFRKERTGREAAVGS